MTDPWKIQNSTSLENSENLEATHGNSHEKSLEFEDNFAPNAEKTPLDNTQVVRATDANNCNEHQPLPDSATYLQSLERKLQKIQKGVNLVEALGEKRQQCLRTLLQEEDPKEQPPCSNNNELLDLDTPIANSVSTVQGIYRHLQPVQPLSVGEIVHIVRYDQLEEQKQEEEEVDEGAEGDNVITMNSELGEVFLFLTNLAWKTRLSIPLLVTTVFLIMDIRLQIEINIQSGQMAAAELEQLDDSEDEIEEYTESVDNESED